MGERGKCPGQEVWGHIRWDASREGEEPSPPRSRQPSPARIQLFFGGWAFCFVLGYVPGRK